MSLTTMTLPTMVVNHHIKVNGVDLFYREAGPNNAPVVLLLHGIYQATSDLCKTS
jgi:pimeloyl-ACP methyl ester carboxylesterase